MGSVKDLLIGDFPGGSLYVKPTAHEFGLGAWQVKGSFSVKDLKEQIPGDITIKNKAEILAMQVGNFFEWMSGHHPDITTCYMGMLDAAGNITDTTTLADRGELSSIVVMELAHVPETFSQGNLGAYRAALLSWELQCAVSDVESIFRKGFPLGSSTFKAIFKVAGIAEEYNTLATYEEVVVGLNAIRQNVIADGMNQSLVEVLRKAKLGEVIPNPGYVLKGFTYDSTTKFESSGDRVIDEEEAQQLSGLSKEGYNTWTKDWFPRIAQAQIDYSEERGIINIDGKGECVTYQGDPVVTDFLCSIDENRLMIVYEKDGIQWAIPSNKEIQRAIFTQAGIDVAKNRAIEQATAAGEMDQWKTYFSGVCKDMSIDLRAVTEHSCRLMEYAAAEVGNRTFGKTLWDAKPLDSWVDSFLPYASKLEHQD